MTPRSAPVALVLALFVVGCGKGNVFDLSVGDCFDDAFYNEAGELFHVSMKDCAEPHEHEVYALVDITESSLPPIGTLYQACFDRFETAIGTPYENSAYGVVAIGPTRQSWDAGDREVVCFVYNWDDPGEKLVGSVLGSGR